MESTDQVPKQPRTQMTPEKAVQLAKDFCTQESWGLDFWREPMAVLASEVEKLKRTTARLRESRKHYMDAYHAARAALPFNWQPKPQASDKTTSTDTGITPEKEEISS